MSLSFKIVPREEAELLQNVVSFVQQESHPAPPTSWSDFRRAHARAPEPSGVPEAPKPTEPPPAAKAPEPDTEQLEQIRRLAREEGLRQGYAQGLEEGRRQVEAEKRAESMSRSSALARSIGRLEQVSQQIQVEAERALGELALGIAERLIRRQVALEPGILLKLIQVVLEGHPQLASVKLSLHPLDLQALEADLPELGKGGDDKRLNLELVADPGLERGDLLVSTEFGQIDGRIQSQLERIRHQFQASFGDSGEGAERA